MKSHTFTSLRGYAAALEDAGLLRKFAGVDQDTYEATAIMYRLTDQLGRRGAPAIWLENIRANSLTHTGPVLANLQGPLKTEAMLLGVPCDGLSDHELYRECTRQALETLQANQGQWPQLPPREIDTSNAPCKQVVSHGDDIDLTRMPFLRGNPGDGSAYINTASVFTRDPELGVNFGTYRCQIKAPRKLMVNFEQGQTGIRMVNSARERGEKEMPVCLVLGQDPMTWMVSSSRVASRVGKSTPLDELAIAGGFAGRPIDVVRSEDQHFLVPAEAEMIIEGTVDLYNLEEEGPYHEMYGYLGRKKERNYVMQVNTVTHREAPWFVNSFTGIVNEYISAPQRAEIIYTLRQSFPQVVDYHAPGDSHGLVYISIKKDAPFQALQVGRPSATHNPLARAVIVVDDDVDVLDSAAVRFALGSRWQPASATEIIDSCRAFPLDPASPDQLHSSAAVIDATRQWPEEGGPQTYQKLNRTVFEEGAPGALSTILDKWPDLHD